jgi:hypothetical protein
MIQTVLRVDNLTNRFIIGSVMKPHSLCVVKGSAQKAEEKSKTEDHMNYLNC